MIVNVIKEHHKYTLGEHDVSEKRGRYLIAMGIAEEVGIYSEKEIKEIKKEKVEFKPIKEKVVRKTRKKK